MSNKYYPKGVLLYRAQITLSGIIFRYTFAVRFHNVVGHAGIVESADVGSALMGCGLA